MSWKQCKNSELEDKSEIMYGLLNGSNANDFE